MTEVGNEASCFLSCICNGVNPHSYRLQEAFIHHYQRLRPGFKGVIHVNFGKKIEFSKVKSATLQALNLLSKLLSAFRMRCQMRIFLRAYISIHSIWQLMHFWRGKKELCGIVIAQSIFPIGSGLCIIRNLVKSSNLRPNQISNLILHQLLFNCGW